MTTIQTSTPAPAAARRSTLAWLSRYGTLLAFLALILFNVAVTPNFLSWQTLNLNLTQVATIVIVATGMTLVIATRGVDLSVGSILAAAAQKRASSGRSPRMIAGMAGRVRRLCFSDTRQDAAALTPSDSCAATGGAICNATAMTDMRFSRA